MKILYADDDQALLSLVKDMLESQNYNVYTALDGQSAISLFFSKIHFDLVILDVMMPQYSGWEVLKQIRTSSDVPVIMLTALSDESNEINGFTNGADDYIAKPFHYEIFLARVNAMIRREKSAQQMNLSEGALCIEQANQKVLSDGCEVSLNHKEYQLLVYLMRNKDIVLTRDLLLDRVWGFDFEGDNRTVDTHIKTLRSKLGVCSAYLQTVWGYGYRFRVNQP